MTVKTDALPAVLGGTPAVSLEHDAANLWPRLTEEDERAVLEVMRSGNITTHPVVRQLEEDYARFVERPYALAHCSGTAALLAAYYALDLQPGDEVLVPSATFWASVVPMLWCGAVPVFCESEGERLGLDPQDVERKISERSRAITVVHLWGLPAKMTELRAIATRHQLKIVEDASHAHGASWRGQRCGTLGDVSVFSLQGDKLAPGGEGGILLCDDYKYYERATCLGDITRIIELQTPAQRFAATSFGIKTRMAPLGAAIARGQLQRLEENNRWRNENLLYLSRGLEELGFHTFLPPPHIERVYFEYLVRYDQERLGLPIDWLINALVAEGCRAQVPRYPLLHQQPIFTEGHFAQVARLGPEIELPTYDPQDLPQTQALSKVLFKLPAFPSAERQILDQYLVAFTKVVNSAAEIRNYYELEESA